MIQAIAEWVMDELPNDQPVDGDCFIDGDDDVFVFVRGGFITHAGLLNKIDSLAGLQLTDIKPGEAFRDGDGDVFVRGEREGRQLNLCIKAPIDWARASASLGHLFEDHSIRLPVHRVKLTIE
jgi:hypothetical protein